MSDFNVWKRRLEDLRSQRDRMQGKVDSAMSELARLGHKTVADAEAAIETQAVEIKTLQAKVSEMKESFEDEYGDLVR